MQHEITKVQKLLDENGNIAEPGFAKRLLWQYAREDIQAPAIRIKEWDYYYVGTQDHGICLTISDAGYVGTVSASILRFGKNPKQMNGAQIKLFPMGKVNMPPTSERGDIHARAGTADFTFENNGEERRLYGSFDHYCNTKKALIFDIRLTEIPPESMVIATPFEKDKHFYYNQKINCMRAEGFFEYDGTRYDFNRENGALATLDWGRGVWTYDNTWLWGSGQTVLDSGDVFGFNIGYGFGDTSAASENMLFFNGKAHKLEDVRFNIPMRGKKYLYTEPLPFTSSDGIFEVVFKPVIDRYDPIDAMVMCMSPHQVFGRISGTAILDDGTKIKIKNKMAFAERVHNKW